MVKKAFLLMLLMAFFAPWAANAQMTATATCYPPSEEYATGYTTSSDKTSGEMHVQSAGGVRGWMMFDVSAIPNNATITSITLKFYFYDTSFPYVYANSAGGLNPTTATASDLFSAIGTSSSPYYTIKDLSTSNIGWRSYALSSDAISNLQSNGLTSDYFTIGFFAYESSSYYCYAYGYNNTDYKPYIEVGYTYTPTDPYIVLDPTDATLLVNKTATLTATVGNVTGTPTITYTSSNEDVATVSGSGTTATVTAVSEGTTTITATMNYGGTDYTSTCDVTVIEACQPTWTGTSSYYINNFTVTSSGTSLLNNSSTGTARTTTNYYATKSITAKPGDELTCTITMNSSGTYGFALWVDFDDDGLEASDKLFGTTGFKNSPYTGTFTIPANTEAGEYRLRILGDFNTGSPSAPCGSYQNGEAEDYKLIVYIPEYPKPVDPHMVDATGTTANIAWTAPESSSHTISRYSYNYKKQDETIWSADAFTTNTSAPLDELTALTDYDFRVKAWYDNNTEESEYATTTFSTTCPDNFPLGYTCGFEGPNTTDSYPLPLCWTRMGSHENYPYVVTSQHHGEGSRSLQFYKSSSSTYNNEIAALPAIDANLKEVRVVFYGKLSQASTDGTINVGYVTSLTDATSFQLVETVTLSTSWEKHAVTFNNVGNATGNIAFQAFYNSAYAYIYIDDVSVEEIPSCTEPTGLAEVPETATDQSLTFNWTAGGTETTWQIQYKKSTEEEWTTYPNAVTEKPFELPGLEASSTYNVRVAAWCTPSDPEGISSYSESVTAKTECGSITVDADHHYDENFNDYTAGTTSSGAPSNYPDDELPLCWSFLNRGATQYAYPVAFLTSSTDYAVSGNCLFFKATSSKPIYAILPAFTNNISDLMLTFTYRNEGTSASNGTLYVSYMTDPTDATTFNTDDAVVCEKKDTKTEKEVFFANAPAGSYIAFMYQGGSTTSYYLGIDDVKVELAPSCHKPSALKCDAKTAHTATLSWTNGSTEQDAWQIAYSTSSSFAPAADFTPGENEWLVNADANPFTIEGLAQSTYYYAYVRANCGTDGNSAWCSTKLSFQTSAGNATPTGLAVEQSTITHEQATASWNAVAGNTLHQSYDLYWATSDVTTVPEEPAAPNFISGITETSKTITGLAEDTNYKVWVRDNCGTDGYSEWSSAVSFKTAKSCQTPDGLQASEVTSNSATITWNTYGKTEFNLSYSVDNGESWSSYPSISCPFTFPDNLIANTTYLVKVQATCDTEAWSSELSFKTECGAITIDGDHKWREDFEEPVTTATSTTTTGLVVPDCWGEPYTTSSNLYVKPHIISKTAGDSYNFSNPKSQVLFFYGADGYAALPEFANAINELQISFNWAVENKSYGTLKLGYITSEDNGTYNTFQDIASIAASKAHTAKTMQDTTIYLNNVPTEAARLVFLWTGTSNYYCNIDDVEVSLTPSCYPVGTLSYANVLSRSVELSWNLVDDTQDAWQVQYANYADFTENVHDVDADTNEDFLLEELSPETHYYVRVRANCDTDGFGEWSNVIDFTTTEDCPAPSDIEITSAQYTADITWNGESDSYNIQYRTAAAPTTTQLFFEGFETYADEDELEAVWTVLDLGDGDNTEELGLSADAKKTDDYGFRFSSYNGSSYGDFDQYLISPELTNIGLLEFAYKSSNGSQDVFRVGYSSTTNDVSAFTWSDQIAPTAAWKTFSDIMPADAKYFAINYTAVYKFYLYIDDITIYKMQEASAWTPATPLTTTEKSIQIDELTFSTKYDVRIQGVCDETPGNWNTASFETVPYRTFTTAGNWNVAANWTPAGIPGENDDVAINAAAIIPANYTAKVDKIAILSDGSITLANSGLNITSSGQLWHNNTGVEATVNVRIYGYSGEKDNYHLIASPFANDLDLEGTTIVDDSEPESNFDLFMFDQSADKEWRNYKQGEFDALINGQGYLYANNKEGWNNFELTGTLQPSNVDKKVTLTYTEGYRLTGWNLVGNPFACNAYVKDASSTDIAYYRMNADGDGFTAATGAIAPMEGIFVQATEAGQSFYFSRTAPSAKSAQLNVNLSNGANSLADNAIVRFDGGNDLEKFSFSNDNAKVYIPQDGKDYAVVNAEEHGEMPVNFKANKNGSYTLSFTAQDVEFSYLHLIDNMTGNDVDLLAHPSYSFDASTTDLSNRFQLVFAKGNNTSDDNFGFISNGNLVILGIEGEATLQVIDVTGRILSSETFSGNYNKAIKATAGVYVLRLINGEKTMTQKIVVR